jgi:hypothetical protein
MRTIFGQRSPAGGGATEGAFFLAAKARHHVISPALAAAADDVCYALVAELVDALGLGSSDESCGGSSPSERTTKPVVCGPGNGYRVRRFQECSYLAATLTTAVH